MSRSAVDSRGFASIFLSVRHWGPHFVDMAQEGPPKSPDTSKVEMIYVIGAGELDGNGCLDVGHCLRWMDLATCACAEAHSGVTCVTVAVSDLYFEADVARDEVVVITALPVLVGSTSIDVSVTVRPVARRGALRAARRPRCRAPPFRRRRDDAGQLSTRRTRSEAVVRFPPARVRARPLPRESRRPRCRAPRASDGRRDATRRMNLGARVGARRALPTHDGRARRRERGVSRRRCSPPPLHPSTGARRGPRDRRLEARLPPLPSTRRI